MGRPQSGGVKEGDPRSGGGMGSVGDMGIWGYGVMAKGGDLKVEGVWDQWGIWGYGGERGGGPEMGGKGGPSK